MTIEIERLKKVPFDEWMIRFKFQEEDENEEVTSFESPLIFLNDDSAYQLYISKEYLEMAVGKPWYDPACGGGYSFSKDKVKVVPLTKKEKSVVNNIFQRLQSGHRKIKHLCKEAEKLEREAEKLREAADDIDF